MLHCSDVIVCVFHQVNLDCFVLTYLIPVTEGLSPIWITMKDCCFFLDVDGITVVTNPSMTSPHKPNHVSTKRKVVINLRYRDKNSGFFYENLQIIV